MAIILGILIGLVAVAAMLVVVTMRWLQALIDAWRRITVHLSGGVLFILPDRPARSLPPLPSDPAPEQINNSERHM